jgi:hypothetical protein
VLVAAAATVFVAVGVCVVTGNSVAEGISVGLVAGGCVADGGVEVDVDVGV